MGLFWAIEKSHKIGFHFRNSDLVFNNLVGLAFKTSLWYSSDVAPRNLYFLYFHGTIYTYPCNFNGWFKKLEILYLTISIKF